MKDINSLLSYLPNSLVVYIEPYLSKVSPESLRLMLSGLTLLFIAVAMVFTVYCFYKARGWHRYQGRWVSPEQFQKIVQELYDGVRSGRVPDYETMKILDEYVYGRKGSEIRRMTKADHI